MLCTGYLRLMFSTILLLTGLPAMAAESGSGSNASFRFPDSDHRLICAQELLGADEQTLWKARNEIFARKGYRFSDSKARQFFETQGYYRSAPGHVELNPIEAQNVNTIRRFEAYLRDYPERAFEANYEIMDSLMIRGKGIAVRACTSEQCRQIGYLKPGCAVNTDIRMDKPHWVYVRSSFCGNAPGPSDGYVPKSAVRLTAG